MKSVLSLVAVLGVVFFGMKSCVESDWYQESERKRRAEERAEQTPHVIREADGCKVYAFKGGDGRYHYFTRCQDSKTATESSYTVNCGKNCTRTETETIEATK